MNDTRAIATTWEPLVQALRLELQEYGGLCVLLEQQQKAILDRNMPDYMGLAEEIEAQAAATSGLRAEREQLVRSFAEGFGKDPGSELSSLIGHFPQEARALLQALVEEIRHQLAKSQRRAKQNHLLLARALQYTYELLQQVSPQTQVRTYGAKGKASMRAYVTITSGVNTSA
jgi:flagellar biosynthesis/type III secretory pathway chaperone